MEITRTRSLTISMGDYESFRTEATVTVTADDLGYTDDVRAATDSDDMAMHLLDAANRAIDLAMEGDIADAQALTGNRKSFINRIPTEKD